MKSPTESKTTKPSDKSKIALVLPAYNEELTIGDTIEAFYKVRSDLFFVVVDNNSSDKTSQVAQEAFTRLDIDGVIYRELRQGKGYAVRRAFQEVDADIYVMTDADMTYPAEALPDLLQVVLNGEADMVVGNRHHNQRYASENKRPFHNFGNHLVRKLINVLFTNDLKDIMTGYRVFTRRFVRLFPLMSPGFQLETEVTLHALDKRYRIVEIPVDYLDRPEGSDSKLNTFRDGFRVLSTILNVFRFFRPLSFFGAIAAMFFTSGLAAGAPVLIEFAETRYITHVPLAILASGLGILGMVTVAIGLVLDALTKANAAQYELRVNAYSDKS